MMITGAPKLILLTMVKNESRIIERLMGSVRGKVDAIVICDTGSTDNTVELATKWLGENGVPGKVYTYPFKNFGKSRTQSFECCQDWVASVGWDAASSWALLLDGDMMLSADINRAALAAQGPHIAGVSLKQANGSLLYSNMRVLRCSEPWICKGATHEAWTCPPTKQTIQFDSPVLTDHGDGGCKADKYPRDVRLLKEDLVELPNDARTLFYLGQTYLCMRDWKNAIETLKKRVEVAGWDEETYIAQVYLGECYEAEGRGAEAVQVWMDAWQRRQHRTEAAMRLITFYRKQPKSQFLAGMFLDKLFAVQTGQGFSTGEVVGAPAGNNDILFVNKRDVDYHIWEEAAILGFYTGAARPTWLRLDELDLTTKLHWHDYNQLFGQVHWYDWLLKPRRQARFAIPLDRLPWATEEQAGCWQPFNPSIRPKAGGGYQVNLRYANYFTKEAKHYAYRGFDGQVLTRNCLLDISGADHPDWNSPVRIEEIKINPAYKQKESHYIRGVEDCRLVQGASDSLEYMGTSQSYSDNGTNKIFHVWRGAEEETGWHLKQQALPAGVSPTETQKNWLPFRRAESGGALMHIYSFSPFRVCDSATGRAVITVDTTASGQKFSLKEYRGSAGPAEWQAPAGSPFSDERWLCVMHKVYIGGDGRRYYHRFITLDKDLLPSRVSCWVRMTNERVEYWSGIARGVGEDGAATYWVTYGLQDSQAYVAELGAAEIERLLFYSLKTGVAPTVRDRQAAVISAAS
jgi:glycosyltransferase involved in cell wall biosynthesis